MYSAPLASGTAAEGAHLAPAASPPRSASSPLASRPEVSPKPQRRTGTGQLFGQEMERVSSPFSSPQSSPAQKRTSSAHAAASPPQQRDLGGAAAAPSSAPPAPLTDAALGTAALATALPGTPGAQLAELSALLEGALAAEQVRRARRAAPPTR